MASGVQAIFTVSAEPDQCVSITRSIGGMFFNGNGCMVMGDPKCDLAEPQFCATGTEISGRVSTLGPTGVGTNCPNNSNGSNSVEGVEVSITSPSGGNCDAVTKDNGIYTCTLCGSGPFTVCVDSAIN